MPFRSTFFISAALACTLVSFDSPDGSGPVIGRTMELGIPYAASQKESIFFYPPGFVPAFVPYFSSGYASWKPSLFGFLALQFDLGAEWRVPFTHAAFTTEGMNSQGLTVSVLVLAGSSYEAVNTSKPIMLPYPFLAEYLLGHYATVAEVETALHVSLNVVDEPIKVGLHWSVQDEKGDSLVIEYVGGQLKTFRDKGVGVLTNDPPYEWQLGYLNQFSSFPTSNEPFAYTAKVEGGPYMSSGVKATVPSVVSHGTFTRQLPGSYTPPDRFAKVFLLRQLALHKGSDILKTVEDSITLATGLINTVHIVRGTIEPKPSTGKFGEIVLEYTNWAAVKIPKKKWFLYRTYDHPQWKRIDLSKVDFTKKHAPIPLYDIQETPNDIQDVTPLVRH